MSADKTVILPGIGNATVGTQLSGIYELDDRIGSGGMGEVYRGHNIQTGDHVAIKIVLPEYADNQTILSLVRKEASILNRLSHDAIVRYHVFTIDPSIGRPYLAMEFVDGESLLDLMRHGPMSTADVRKLCHRLASGLSAVHEAGAVHRDLSPDNIILPGGKVERAKIIDFGIARSATIGGETLIGGGFAGKYNYVSPEQLGLYGGDVREASDIYSLGLVLAAAMRGKPIEMDGSQLQVVEKRRIVPDLSGIDPEFRPIIEAMLQPDPTDRPASMAEIAGMTRDDTAIAPPRSLPQRSPGPASAKTELSSPPRATSGSTTSWSGAREPDFVPYIPPAHLSQSRPAPGPALEAAPAKKLSTARNIALAAAASVIVAVGAGAYLGGFLTPPDQDSAVAANETSPPSAAIASETSPLAPEPAAERTADASAGGQPAESTAPSVPHETAAAPPANPPEDMNEQDQATAPVAEAAAASAATEEAPAPVAEQSAAAEEQRATAAQPVAEPAKPEPQSAAPAPSEQQDVASGGGKTPPTAGSGEAAVAPRPAIQPESPPEDTGAQEQATVPVVDTVAVSKATATNEEPAAAQPVPVVQQPATVAQPVAEPAKPEPHVAAPASPARPTGQQATANEAAQPALAPAPKPGETTVAMNVPAPSATASDSIDTVADRISWLRDYRGGDCFYATVTSATDKAIEIEGFGTTVGPFEQMLEAFQAKFHVEPDVSVRLIAPAQCEITNFLRALGATTAKRPKLALDRTSVPNGSAISGTLEARGGLRTSLLLIDNKGMAFSLDKHVVVQGGKAIFNVPISLGAVDQAAGKTVPQIIVAVTGDVDLNSAEFSHSTAATVALPNILAEIQAKGLEFSATAKYFRLGG